MPLSLLNASPLLDAVGTWQLADWTPVDLALTDLRAAIDRGDQDGAASALVRLALCAPPSPRVRRSLGPPADEPPVMDAKHTTRMLINQVVHRLADEQPVPPAEPDAPPPRVAIETDQNR